MSLLLLAVRKARQVGQWLLTFCCRDRNPLLRQPCLLHVQSVLLVLLLLDSCLRMVLQLLLHMLLCYHLLLLVLLLLLHSLLRLHLLLDLLLLQPLLPF